MLHPLVDGPVTVHMWVALAGLSRFFNSKNKEHTTLWAEMEGENRGGCDHIALHAYMKSSKNTFLNCGLLMPDLEEFHMYSREKSKECVYIRDIQPRTSTGKE